MSSNLITKIYFPRILIPIAAIGAVLVDYVIALLLLVVILGIQDVLPTARAFFVLPLTLLTVCAALSLGVLFSALNVRFRDVRHAIPFLTQFLLFASPIAYPVATISGIWETIYNLNPMVGIAESFRWAVLDVNPFPATAFWSAIGVTFAFLVIALRYFRRVERLHSRMWFECQKTQSWLGTCPNAIVSAFPLGTTASQKPFNKQLFGYLDLELEAFQRKPICYGHSET